MRNIRASFSFFGAGQGAFYGGQIYNKNNNRNYKIVYDCGTSPWIAGQAQSLNNEINQFRFYPAGFENPDIDILFISHLDYDHVSGVMRLINEFNVRRIIIPYFPQELRKYALLSIGDPNDDFTIEQYSNFIENPYSFLVTNTEETDVFAVSQEFIEDVEYASDSIREDSDELTVHGNRIENKPEELIDERIYYYQNNFQVFVGSIWEFTTYVKEITDVQFRNLRISLNRILNRQDEHRITYQDLRNILSNDANRKKAHSKYKKYLSDINAHGLVLFHSPINFKSCQLISFIQNEISNNICRRRFNFSQQYWGRYFNNVNNMIGTLLMGDTSLSPANNQIIFPEAFLRKLRYVLVFQVPHHGSKKSWDLQYYNQLNLGTNLKYRPVLNVCNFGYGNTYGHPSHIVLDNLSGSFIPNTQFSDFALDYNLIY